MNIKFFPEHSSKCIPFNAQHPMFSYECGEGSSDISAMMRRYEKIVVIGLGGSILPLKVFVDFFALQDRIFLLDTVDPDSWNKVKDLKALYCVVSKSGETLEIKSLLAELVNLRALDRTLIVTDPETGWLRKWARENRLPTLSIPKNIGGRFTHFTEFHRLLLERFEVPFREMMKVARDTCVSLKSDPKKLQILFEQCFEKDRSQLVLWIYGESLLGLGQWIQQAIAESLGKRDSKGIRHGLMPIVLKGPQDQHSVLQLLRDGPQKNALWFFTLERPASPKKSMSGDFSIFSNLGLSEAMNILSESTLRSFVERLDNPETFQPLSHFQLKSKSDSLAEVIATIQAFIEYSGNRLDINPYDQPGVERGKEIARTLVQAFSG